MEYKNTYHNIDTILSFKITGQINEDNYNKFSKITDYYLKKIITSYDLINILIKLSNLFSLFKDNLIVVNYNDDKNTFNLKYKDNKLFYYYKTKIINNKSLEIKYQNNKFEITEPDPSLYQEGHEEKDYEEIARTIINEIETYKSLKELKETKVEISDEIKEFYGLYKLFFKEEASLLDTRIYLKATCMYFIIENILGVNYFDGYYLKNNIISNFNIDTLVYNYLELVNIKNFDIEIDKRVGTIGYKIRQYFKDNFNKLLEFTNYLYNRELNIEKENIEFENLINDIHYNLEAYKRNVKRKKYLTRFN